MNYNISSYSELQVRKEAVSIRKHFHKIKKCSQKIISQYAKISQSSVSRIESLDPTINTVILTSYIDGLIQFVSDLKDIDPKFQIENISILSQLKKRLIQLSNIDEKELIDHKIENDFAEIMKILLILNNLPIETRKFYQIEFIIATLSRFMVFFGFSSKKFDPIFEMVETIIKQDEDKAILSGDIRYIELYIFMWLKNILLVNRNESDKYLLKMKTALDFLELEFTRAKLAAGNQYKSITATSEENTLIVQNLLRSRDNISIPNSKLRINERILRTYQIAEHQINGDDASFEGDFVKAENRLSSAIEMLETYEYMGLDFSFEAQQNPYVTCRTDLARTLYFMGDQKKAFELIKEAYDHCTDNPFDEVFILFDEIELLYLSRNYYQVLKKSQLLLEKTQENSFYQYNRMAKFYYEIALKKATLSRKSNFTIADLSPLQKILVTLEDNNIRLGLTRNYCILAELCFEANEIDYGLDIVNKGILDAENSRERYYLSELYRVRALLYTKVPEKKHVDIIAEFKKGLDVAESKEQKALSFQLSIKNSMLFYYMNSEISEPAEEKKITFEIYKLFKEIGYRGSCELNDTDDIYAIENLSDEVLIITPDFYWDLEDKRFKELVTNNLSKKKMKYTYIYPRSSRNKSKVFEEKIKKKSEETEIDITELICLIEISDDDYFDFRYEHAIYDPFSEKKNGYIIDFFGDQGDASLNLVMSQTHLEEVMKKIEEFRSLDAQKTA